MAASNCGLNPCGPDGAYLRYSLRAQRLVIIPRITFLFVADGIVVEVADVDGSCKYSALTGGELESA